MKQSHPPTSVGWQAWGEWPYLHDLLGFQPHDSLETQGFLSAERVSAQAAVRRVCSPKHRRGQEGTYEVRQAQIPPGTLESDLLPS